jgi:hypothetical protein
MLGTSNNYVTSNIRKDFQVSFVIYIPNTPVGCTNVNSPENQVPLGGYCRGHPPKKWSNFFANIHCKCATYASTQILGELTRDASGQRSKKRESGIAYAFSRIQPFPLAALPTSYLCE